MAKTVNYMPKNYHAVTPHLVVKNAKEAIEFYKKAFSAKELYRMDRPSGKVMHAELQVGDSIIMLADECDAPHPGHEQNCAHSPDTLKGTTVSLFLYVKNVDHVFSQALGAGAKESMPVSDMFWGDRVGAVLDLSGHIWMIATHIRDVSPKELEEGARAFYPKKSQ